MVAVAGGHLTTLDPNLAFAWAHKPHFHLPGDLLQSVLYNAQAAGPARQGIIAPRSVPAKVTGLVRPKPAGGPPGPAPRQSWHSIRPMLWNKVTRSKLSPSEYTGDVYTFLAARPGFEIYHYQDQPGRVAPPAKEARIVMWDSQRKRKLSKEESPLPAKLPAFLEVRPECEVYDGQVAQVSSPGAKAADEYLVAMELARMHGSPFIKPDAKRQRAAGSPCGERAILP